MKRVIALLLCIVLSVGVLASCSIDGIMGGETHTHTYSETWSSDSEGHWYEPTCDCEDVDFQKLSHTDLNNDGACDICTFTNHTHTYSEDWTVDCTNHWHAADCGHIVAGADVEAHEDENEDGKCDTCNYVIEDIHSHYYSSEWSGDGEYHWHAALCDHKEEAADKAAHEVNAAGLCTVCGARVNEVDMTDFAAVLAAAVAQNHKVIDGNVIAGEYVYGGSGDDLYVETYKINDVYFVLGEGQSYIHYKTLDDFENIIGADQYWFQLIGEDEVFGVAMQDGSQLLIPIDGETDKLNGYTYFPGVILSASENTETLSQTLHDLYALINDENSSEKTAEYDAQTGIYSFSYNYFSVNQTTEHSGEGSGATINYQVELYEVEAQFTVDSNFVIDYAEFTVKSYRNLDIDEDITYDPENNTVAFTDGANPTVYSYFVAQRSGDKTFTTPYPKTSLIPTSFDLYLVNEIQWDENYTSFAVTDRDLIEESITVDVGAYQRFQLANIFPKTSNLHFIEEEDLILTFTNNNPNAAGVLWDTNDAFKAASYSAYSGCISFVPQDVGEYTMTVQYGRVNKSITVIVNGSSNPTLLPDDENTVHVATTDTYGYSDEYSYTAKKTGIYTFTVPTGLGVWEKDAYDAQSADPEIDYYDNTEGATFSYKLVKGQTYSFYVAAKTEDVWIISVSYEESEPVGVILDGDYAAALNGCDLMFFYDGDNSTYYMNVINGSEYSIYFTYAATENIDGTITLDPTFASEYYQNEGEDVDGIGDMIIVATPVGDSWSFAAEEQEEGSDGLIPENATKAALTIGYNQITQKNYVFTYTAAADGTLTLTTAVSIMGDVAFKYVVNGGVVQTLELSSSVELSLSAGDVVEVIVIATGYSTLTAAWVQSIQ